MRYQYGIGRIKGNQMHFLYRYHGHVDKTNKTLQVNRQEKTEVAKQTKLTF